MNNIPFTSIKSVLFDISTMLDSTEWNEEKMTEWAIRGFKKLNLHTGFQEKVCIAEIINHKAQLPSDVVYINQAAVRSKFDEANLTTIKQIIGVDSTSYYNALDHVTFPDSLATKALAIYNSSNNWEPMKPASSTFMQTVTLDNAFQINTSTCRSEYSVNGSGCMTTTDKDGYILLSYLGYAEDADGNTLIPNNANLKEALLHFCLYRYWMTKANQHEQNAGNLRNFHLELWQVNSQKAKGDLNMPDIGTMENIRNQQLNMLPRSNGFDNFFRDQNVSRNPRF